MSPAPFRLLIAGAGTGGHLYPGVAVAQVLRKRDPEAKILFAVGLRDIEAEIVTREGMSCVRLPAAPFPRSPAALFRSAWLNGRGILKARKVLDEFKPDAVFSTGGFVSGVVALPAWSRGLPLILHESNSLPGLANRLLAPLARVVITAYPEAAKKLGRKAQALGTPVRPSLFQGDRAETLLKHGLDPGRFTILALGGSQGARGLNQALLEFVSHPVEFYQPVQILWQAGHAHYQQVVTGCEKTAFKTAVRPFLYNMPGAYAAADLVLSRAGASTVAEILALGKPAVLVPYPYSAGGHQAANARVLHERGAVIAVPEEELSGGKLAEILGPLIREPGRLSAMSAAALGMGVRDAAEKVMDEILKAAGRG